MVSFRTVRSSEHGPSSGSTIGPARGATSASVSIWGRENLEVRGTQLQLHNAKRAESAKVNAEQNSERRCYAVFGVQGPRIPWIHHRRAPRTAARSAPPPPADMMDRGEESNQNFSRVSGLRRNNFPSFPKLAKFVVGRV